jgi:hypothetical protein
MDGSEHHAPYRGEGEIYVAGATLNGERIRRKESPMRASRQVWSATNE